MTMNESNVYSTWANLLASENLTFIIDPHCQTAVFDGIQRTLTLPLYNDALQPETKEMLIVHEVGHALYTMAERSVTQCQLVGEGIFGVFEDARVDQLMQIKFPGTTRQYHHGQRQLFELDFFGIQQKSFENLKKESFLNRMNLMIKGYKKFSGQSLFNHPIEESFFIRAQTEINIKDSNQLMKDVYHYLLKQKENDSNKNIIISKIDLTSSKNISFKQTPPLDKTHDDMLDEDNMNCSNETIQAVKNQQVSSNVYLNHRLKDQLQQNKTYNNTVTINLPEFKEELMLCPLYYHRRKNHFLNYFFKFLADELRSKKISGFDEEFNLIEKQCHTVATQMTSIFLQTQNAYNEQLGTEFLSGIIDQTKMFQYKTESKILSKYIEKRQEKNHGFVIMLDWSQSMNKELFIIYRYISIMIKFAHMNKIPIQLFAFSNNHSLDELMNPEKQPIHYSHDNVISYNTSFVVLDIFDSYKGDVATARFYKELYQLISIQWKCPFSEKYISLINKYNTQYQSKYIQTKILFSFNPLLTNSTPLFEGLLYSYAKLKKIRQTTNIDNLNFILITDGLDDQLTSNFCNIYNKNNELSYLKYHKHYWLQFDHMLSSLDVSYSLFYKSIIKELMYRFKSSLNVNVEWFYLTFSVNKFIKHFSMFLDEKNNQIQWENNYDKLKSEFGLKYYFQKEFKFGTTYFISTVNDYKNINLSHYNLATKKGRIASIKFLKKLSNEHIITKLIFESLLKKIR